MAKPQLNERMKRRENRRARKAVKPDDRHPVYGTVPAKGPVALFDWLVMFRGWFK